MLPERSLQKRRDAAPGPWLISLTAVIAIGLFAAGARWLPYPRYVLGGVALGLYIATRAASRGHLGSPLRTAVFGLLGLAAFVVAVRGHDVGSFLLAAAACAALVGPAAPPKPASREERRRLWRMIDRTPGDTMAPFALRTDKSYIYSPDGRAAVSYRVRWGTAVVACDPVGDPASHEAAFEAFFAQASEAGWRVAALGLSERTRAFWQAKGYWTLAIGREVVLDSATFKMEGRRFRNLRQAVQHTRNAGVTTEIVPESSLTAAQRNELLDLLRHTPKGVNPRGFAMILDRPLMAEHPGTFAAIARDSQGRVVACQRYATCDNGREVSLDIPWRLENAPNGSDERLIIDALEWAKGRGAQRMSLCFAPFPDLFGAEKRTWLHKVAFWGLHSLDRFIQLESLFRFLKKFHSFGEARYLAVHRRDLVLGAAAILSLEFGPTASHDDRG